MFVRCPEPFIKYSFFVVFAVFLHFSGFSQIRCGTVEYTEKLQAQKTLFEGKDQFEKWIQGKQQARARQNGAQRTASTYQVPVVVHVIHNGEAVGSGTNISDAQILSQLSVLNKDYQRLNADAGETPAEFVPVAGNFDVEFVLAKQNPEGLATNGIVRVKGPMTTWSMDDNYALKSLSYWPAEDYLNIWVCNMTDFLGFAQFPVSGLPGLENSSTNRLTDGVVIAYNVFGSIDDGSFNLKANYDKGRTATHEIGHFFGLRHIWGDDNGACSGTDYVDDTPNQSGSTSGCPTHPHVTCTVTSMFQNYLDYTNDQCMNLFTQGQVGRMITVIENSPRRASLPISHGLSDPLPIANDMGIKDIISPLAGECAGSFGTSVEVRNYGSNTISSARIRVKKDGVNTETKNFTFSTPIPILASQILNFNPITFAGGNHNVTYEILLVNGVADGNTLNNVAGRDVFVPAAIAIPFLETFKAIPATWSVVNPDQNLTWELAVTPTSGTNKAMKMAFYDYEDHQGEIDLLVTPVFDLTSAPAALLKFDVAYARYQSSNDGLKVVLLSGCNTNIAQSIVLYDKAGQSLASTAATSADFTPSGPDQWRSESIDLSTYIGQSNLQLAFVGLNDWGNNLYLDNISLTTDPISDVSLSAVIAPAPVTCSNQVSPVLRVKNTGTLLSSFTINGVINGQAFSQSVSGLSLERDKEMDIELLPVSLADGINTLSFELVDPNGEPDFNPANNSIELSTTVNKATDQLPIKQDFEGSFETQWTSINPAGGMTWKKIALSSTNAIYFNAFTNTVRGDNAWLVSPALDFSDTEGASLSYDLSYAFRSGTLDMLQILASTDCGTTFSDTIASFAGAALADGRTSTTSWKPESQADWTGKSHVLSSLAGQQNVRIAFVFTNDNGNNIYLDNLQFFVSDSPIKLTEVFSVYPNPTPDGEAFITFNLNEKGTITLDVIDAMGKIMITETRDDILNQTLPFQLTSASAGVYLVRVTAGNRVYFKKLMVSR